MEVRQTCEGETQQGEGEDQEEGRVVRGVEAEVGGEAAEVGFWGGLGVGFGFGVGCGLGVGGRELDWGDIGGGGGEIGKGIGCLVDAGVWIGTFGIHRSRYMHTGIDRCEAMRGCV